MAPLVWSRRYKRNLPAWQVYFDVREILYKEYPDNERKQKIVEEYRERILGKSCLASAPDEYWEIGLAAELEIPLVEWRKYPLDIRAQYMARQYLANMVSTIDRHYEEQDELKKKNQKKDSNGSSES